MVNQKGIIALAITVVAMFLTTSLALSAVFVFLNRAEASKNIVRSYEAIYASEAGIEDALLRVLDDTKSFSIASSYTFLVNQSIASTTIGVAVGGSRTITSSGSKQSRVRKIKINTMISLEEAKFFYGAQVGAGGIEMGLNSRIEGNVFSNGSVIGENEKGYIIGSVTVTGDGNKIEDLNVEVDAFAHSCKDSIIAGSLTYVADGTVDDCTAEGGTSSQATSTASIALPLSTSTIDGWKQDAIGGGIISSGDYNPSKGTYSIGPGVIQGDMILDADIDIILMGTVYVNGNIDIDHNGASIVLDSQYGNNSGIIINDGWVHIRNNSSLSGSGEEGSHLLLLTTSGCDGTSSSGCTHHNAAVDLHNNASGAILYAGSGMVNMHNGVSVKEITAYKIKLENNAIIKYESGLSSSMFSSGPSGGRQVSAWTEAE